MKIKLLLINTKNTLLDSNYALSPIDRDALLDAQDRFGVRVALLVDADDECIAPLQEELRLDKYGSYIISHKEQKILNCRTKNTLDTEGVSLVTLFMEKLDLLKIEIAAIGNEEADIDMIQSAGLGVALANATEVVKSCADYVSKSREDNGIAHFINKYVRSHQKPLPYTPEQVEELFQGTMMEALGMKCTVLNEGYIEMTMEVTHKTAQPMGILHGGANLALSESIAGIGSTLLLEPGYVQVGAQVNGYHMARAAFGDTMRAEARIIHKGKTTHIWDIQVYSMNSGKLIHTARVLNSILKLR